MANETEANAPTNAPEASNGVTPSNAPEPTRQEILAGSDTKALRALARKEMEATPPLALEEESASLAGDEPFNPFEDGEPEESPENTNEPEVNPEPEENDEEVDTDKPAPKRIRVKVDHLSARDRAVTELMGREGLSMEEAFERVTGNKFGAPTAPPEPKTDTPPVDTPTVAKQKETIAELRKQRTQAAKDFKLDEVDALDLKIEEAREVLDELKLVERDTTREQQNQFMSLRDESEARAIAAYPDANKEGTPLFKAIEADVERLKAVNPGFFNDPEWPETLAAKQAAKLNIPRAGATPKAPVVPKKPVAKTPVPDPSNGNPPPVQAKAMSDAERKAWMSDPNTTAADLRAYIKSEAAKGRRMVV